MVSARSGSATERPTQGAEISFPVDTSEGKQFSPTEGPESQARLTRVSTGVETTRVQCPAHHYPVLSLSLFSVSPSYPGTSGSDRPQAARRAVS